MACFDFKDGLGKATINKTLLNKERLVTALRLPLEAVESLTLHSASTNPFSRELDVFIEAAVHSLTRDSADVEHETVEKTFDTTLQKAVEVTTEEPASWWQHLKKQLGWQYETKRVVHKLDVTITGPVSAKFTVPVKRSYKKVFFGLPSNELAYRVFNMWPESDFEKSDEYWNDYVMRHREAAMYMAPFKYKDIVKEVAVR